MQANRALLDYRFHYRLTSMMLRASREPGGKQLEAKYKAARRKSVKATQEFDRYLNREVYQRPAEIHIRKYLSKLLAFWAKNDKHA